MYPFEETVAHKNVSFSEAIEQIDIGGPSMLRSAAKNHGDVTVVCDPADYDRVLAGLGDTEGSIGLRRELALKVFKRTANYDKAITVPNNLINGDTVKVLVNDEKVDKKIKKGPSDGKVTVIVEGLAEGEKIVAN